MAEIESKLLMWKIPTASRAFRQYPLRQIDPSILIKGIFPETAELKYGLADRQGVRSPLGAHGTNFMVERKQAE
jgi:hypothetical protein